MTTRVQLINAALMRIGAAPLQSDVAPGAEVFVEVFDGVMERLAAHPFTFLRQTRKLTRLATLPEAVWTYAYQLPAELLGAPRAAYQDAATDVPLTAWDIQGDQLLTNAEQVWLAFPALGRPERWPGDFRELSRLALMAEYALSVREDRALHDRLYQKAFGSPGQNGLGGLLLSCLENDAQATPSTIVGGGVNPLLDIRGGGL